MGWGVTGRAAQAKAAEPGHHHLHHYLTMLLVPTCTQSWSTSTQGMTMQTVHRLLGIIVTVSRTAQQDFAVAHICRQDVPAPHSSPGHLSQSTWRSEGMELPAWHVLETLLLALSMQGAKAAAIPKTSVTLHLLCFPSSQNAGLVFASSPHTSFSYVVPSLD